MTEFVDVTYAVAYRTDPKVIVDRVLCRVAVDELSTFLSVLIRSGSRNFEVRSVTVDE